MSKYDKPTNKVVMSCRKYPLEASRTVIVPELSFAVIPHGIHLGPGQELVVLIAEDNVFVDKHLLVSVELVTRGEEITTKVFNLSSKRVRLPKGSIVSQLVTLP